MSSRGKKKIGITKVNKLKEEVQKRKQSCNELLIELSVAKERYKRGEISREDLEQYLLQMRAEIMLIGCMQIERHNKRETDELVGLSKELEEALKL